MISHLPSRHLSLELNLWTLHFYFLLQLLIVTLFVSFSFLMVAWNRPWVSCLTAWLFKKRLYFFFGSDWRVCTFFLFIFPNFILINQRNSLMLTTFFSIYGSSSLGLPCSLEFLPLWSRLSFPRYFSCFLLSTNYMLSPNSVLKFLFIFLLWLINMSFFKTSLSKYC